VERTYISFNPVNWATVIVMVVLGWALASVIFQFYKTWFGR
jgi:hypothetical protein